MSAYASAVEDQLNDRLVALRAEASPPRRDRTFFTNLEISRAHAERFRSDGDAMRAKARADPPHRSNTLAEPSTSSSSGKPFSPAPMLTRSPCSRARTNMVPR